MQTPTPSDPDRLLIDVGGGPLSYTDEGSGPPTLVAIHGFPGSSRDFRWLAPALTDDFRVVRIDMPGYGNSPRGERRGGMTIEDRAGVVEAFCAALGLDEITVVTHSSGSTPAAHLARHRPDLVARCAFLAPAGPRPHYSRWLMRAISAVLSSPLPRPVPDTLLARLFAMLGFPRSLPNHERAHTVMDAAVMDFDLHAANLAALSQPCLLGFAEDDPLISVAINEAMSDLIPPGGRLRFAQGGHNIQKTQAVEIADALRTFAS